ncbi:sugar transferase [Lentiprolixibacter aurantiacus]
MKRIFDLLIAIAMILILSPIIVIVSMLLAISNNGTPFFVQERPGRRERIFKLLKFKTMRDFDPVRDEHEHSPSRITKIGSFVRKYSLDELLQLVNVIKGDMSLVGPRPLLVEYLPLYNAEQRKRHLVRPGITGWAQVNGRNSISWDAKFNHDLWYVKNLSLKLDIKILALTFNKILDTKNINASNTHTMPIWEGNKPQKN